MKASAIALVSPPLRSNELYTFEQFADYFADTIYPEYNNLSITRESPNELYNRLPKANTLVPSWRTLSVLKSVTATRVLRSKGIQYGNKRFYWCSELGPLVEKEKNTEFRIFAFDTPFNRSISVVRGHEYIGEAHLIEKLNVVEQRRYKVIQHLMEQQKQYKYYSKRITQLHSLVFQTDILDDVSNVPPVDNIRYGQAIDTERDREESIDSTEIPEELKKQAEAHAANFLNNEDTIGELEQYYAVDFEDRVKSALVSMCRDRQNGSLSNFIEAVELVLPTVRPEWKNISYQIIKETGRVIHGHNEKSQAITSIRPDKIEADLKYEEEKKGKEKVPVVKDPDPPYEYVDVSKLKRVTLDYATFKDALTHKMFVGQ